MGHDKLRKFAENETFACLLQPSAEELLRDGYFALRDHEVKGHWGERFADPSAPLVLELGCGKGEYTIDLAQRDPSKNYVGVDIKGARLWKGAKYATRHNLGNVGFLRTRIEFISAFFAPGEVSEIWLTFSDPQVKSENSRLTSPVFLERYARFLAPGGLIHLKTDSQFLYQYTLAVCRANNLPVLAASEDLYAEADRFAPALTEVQTFYESMFRDQGYQIRYVCFRLTSLAEGAASSDFAPLIPPAAEAAGPSHLSEIVFPPVVPQGTSALRGGHGRPRSAEAAPSSTFVSPQEQELWRPQADAGGVGGYAPRPLGVQGDNSIRIVSPQDFDPDYWRSIEGHRTLFGRDTAETRRQKLKGH